MAPVEATIALSHIDGITDSIRARELYKYVLLEMNPTLLPGPIQLKIL
jgi:hypothetical protein